MRDHLPIACQYCENVFHSSAYNAKYCSYECRQAKSREVANLYYGKVKDKKIVKLKDRIVECPTCTKEFTPETPRAKYCCRECRTY
jgi:hypothetical protein